MPKISALPQVINLEANDEIPIHDVSEATTKKVKFGQLLPTGATIDFAGLAAPAGWLLCFGQTLNGTVAPEYASLYAVIGNLYGGSSIADFKIPDLRGRVVAGQDDMGGTSANRLTGFSGGVDGDVMGAAGGAESHTLINSETPVHGVTLSHHGDEAGSVVRQFSAAGGTAGGTNVGAYRQSSGALGGANSIQSPSVSWGSNGAHNNVQPTSILNKIIKY